MDNNSLVADISTWERGKDYPDFFDDVALSTISKGYLIPGETPRKAYRRVANAVADRLNRPDLANKFFKYIWNGWEYPLVELEGEEQKLQEMDNLKE